MKKLFIMLLALCTLLSACAAPVKESAKLEIQPNELVLQSARTQYRSASLVVRGICTREHKDANGNPCYDVEVTTVIAGDCAVGNIVHCSSSVLELGGEYLMYLKQGEDAYYSEDTTGYILLDNSPLLIKDGKVTWDNISIDVGVLLADIAGQRSVIVAPATSYYYAQLNALAAGTQQIFIGVVESIATQEREFRTVDNGASTENTRRVSIAKIQAYGSIKGELKYGDAITLIQARQSTVETVDDKTLSVKTFGATQIPSLVEGGVYLFFVNRGPDPKQEYYFPVNPVQGYVALDGDALKPSSANEALNGYKELTQLVQRLHYTLSLAYDDENPALILEGIEP
ncbi:MAG: hypothetical protein AAGU74_12470 [Bacillota bacterium]